MNETHGLYLITRPKDLEAGYDEYESAIVCADSREEARKIRPDGKSWDRDPEFAHLSDNWIPASAVNVEYIGTAAPHIKCGTVVHVRYIAS